MKLSLLLMVLGMMLLGGCASGPPPQTVAKVDLDRYRGKWYEISRVTKWFEAGCVASTAEYGALPDGRVSVTNTCHEKTVDGKLRVIKGSARVVDAPRNSKLKVMFSWPFEGDYWIVRLNDDYTTAVVSDASRSTLWVLHRQPQMAEAEYAALVESLKTDGFNVEKLERVPQVRQGTP